MAAWLPSARPTVQEWAVLIRPIAAFQTNDPYGEGTGLGAAAWTAPEPHAPASAFANSSPGPITSTATCPRRRDDLGAIEPFDRRLGRP